MESRDVVLLLLAVLGGVVAVRGVVLDAGRRAQASWREQQSVDRIDFVSAFEAELGDEAALVKGAQRNEQHRLATARDLDEPEQSLTRSEVFRSERGQPYWLTLGGVALSTVSGIVGAVWS